MILWSLVKNSCSNHPLAMHCVCAQTGPILCFTVFSVRLTTESPPPSYTAATHAPLQAAQPPNYTANTSSNQVKSGCHSIYLSLQAWGNPGLVLFIFLREGCEGWCVFKAAFWAECSIEDKRYQLATKDKTCSILCNCVLQFVAVEEIYSPDGLIK